MFERIGGLRDDPDRVRAIATAGLDALLAEPRADAERVGAIGYCFGATVAMELARTGADLKAVVGFHPGLTSARPRDSVNIRAKVLMCIGQDDPVIDAQQRLTFVEEMKSAGVDWQVHLYGDGVKHSFTHPDAGRSGLPGLEFHPVAAARAWRSMQDLFDEVFAQPSPGA
jgi:dienelactone hydrolase